MSLIVLKFGGTSIADAQKIQAAARRAIAAKQVGHRVIVVVSARGQTTDELIDLAQEVNPNPPARELDMLLSTGEQMSVALVAMAIQAQGHSAISFTGSQMGVLTDRIFTRARIRDISTERIRRALDEGQVVVAAGFQGIDPDHNITTLGRGGSDTTAVALAAALGAEFCEVYTDVEGVYTADPRLVPDARKISAISYDEMLELASLGAGVMHSRAIEFAKKYGVPIHVRPSFSDAEGTWIVPAPLERASAVACGVARMRDEARVTLVGVPDRPGTGQQIFSRIAARHIPVDMIVQNIGEHGHTEVSFTVLSSDLEETLAAAREAVADGAAQDVTFDTEVSKISLVGAGMRTQTGVAAQMFAALAKQGVNILMISTSEIKISVLVDRAASEAAMRAVHRAFQLHESSPASETDDPPSRTAQGPKAHGRPPVGFPDLLPLTPNPPTQIASPRLANASAVERLSGMEDLVVTEVTLDAQQSRITIEGVPDRPGIAAQVFEHIAQGDVLVDMIVQNVSTAGATHLSFTVPRDQLDRALHIADHVKSHIGAAAVVAEPKIAKLSVLGIGMRSHTDVASRLFAALAARDINVNLINTSEVRVSVLVDSDYAQEALATLRETFDVPGEGA